MRILHTADWHLGKSLEGNSRLDEQEKFLEDFVNIVDENDVDLVIIAGDIYDTGNPPARAEKLFYSTLKKISNGGKRAVLVIAGNHDNPERLIAAGPLADDHGIILLGTPKDVAEKGHYGDLLINDSGEGYIEIEMRGEKAVIIALPYPSEKRLNEIFTESTDEEERQISYSEKVAQIFASLSSKYREDTINIAVSHLFVAGGKESDSERPIQLGGSMAVDVSALPDKAQYIALGHLHKPQIVSERSNIYYAGSPIQYSKSEIGYSKCCFIVDIKAGQEPDIRQVLFKNYKPIEVFKCSSIEDAIETCRQNKDRDIWAYIEIETDRTLTQSEIKEMKELLPDIVEIIPKIEGMDKEDEGLDMRERSMEELFRDFYMEKTGTELSGELMDLFLDITKEEGGDDETQDAENIGA